jgi:hypothetical protein
LPFAACAIREVTMTYENTSLDDPLAGYLSEDRIAEKRRVSKRTLRSERQRGAGPPFVKLGKQVFYPLDGFRGWLKAIERQPVRSGR